MAIKAIDGLHQDYIINRKIHPKRLFVGEEVYLGDDTSVEIISETRLLDEPGVTVIFSQITDKSGIKYQVHECHIKGNALVPSIQNKDVHVHAGYREARNEYLYRAFGVVVTN